MVLETWGRGRGRETPRKQETRGGGKEKEGWRGKLTQGKMKRVRSERRRKDKGLKEVVL